MSVALLLHGCSDDGDTKQDSGLPDASLAAYGESCKADSDCASKMCVEYKKGKGKICSKICKRLHDCPPFKGKGLDCGKLPSGKLACYPRVYRTGPYVQSHDCSLDGKCDINARCMGQTGDSDRYCADKCETDVDCPPQYRCGTMITGTVKDSVKRCLRRKFCHPCVIDDQCSDLEDLCIPDSKGNRYCSKACTKTGTTCPVEAKCEDAGNSKLQCKHKMGYCQKSFTSDGDTCDPCLVHGWSQPGKYRVTLAEDGICKKEGQCHLWNHYTGEAACMMPCGQSCTTGSCPSTTQKCESSVCACPTGQMCVTRDGMKMCLPVTKDSTGKTIIHTCFP